MSGDEIAYDFAMLNHAADSCKSAVGHMKSRLGDLEATCNGLLASWTGQAQSAYHARQKDWDKAADDLTLLLNGIGQALRESAVQMQASENKNLQRFGG